MSEPLSGVLLIASPSLGDYFHRTVVLLVEHSGEGYFFFLFYLLFFFFFFFFFFYFFYFFFFYLFFFYNLSLQFNIFISFFENTKNNNTQKTNKKQ